MLAGIWMIHPVLAGICLPFVIARRRSLFQPASVLLVGAFCLAVVSVLMQLSFPLMLVANLSALASWDLLLFTQTVKRTETREQISLLEERYHQSLGVAFAGGVLLSHAAANLAFSLPFIAILLLCALVLGGMFFGARALMGNKP
jgi:hypothetical protein